MNSSPCSLTKRSPLLEYFGIALSITGIPTSHKSVKIAEPNPIAKSEMAAKNIASDGYHISSYTLKSDPTLLGIG